MMSKDGMARQLSEGEVRRCENAREPKCVCRCGGKNHGKARIAEDAPRVDYEKLPVEDPHHLQTKAEAKFYAKRRKMVRQAHSYHRASAYVGTVSEGWYKPALPCPMCIAEGRGFEFHCKLCPTPVGIYFARWDLEERTYLHYAPNGERFDHDPTMPDPTDVAAGMP